MVKRTLIAATAMLLVAPAGAVAAPALTIGDISGPEGIGAFPLTISTAEAPAADLTVKVKTGDGSAKAPGDFTAVDLTATIPAGQTSAVVQIPIAGDSLDEADETFTVNLSDVAEPGGSPTIADGQATATITDDDDTPKLAVADEDVAEPSKGTRDATFTVKLSAASGRTVAVQAQTANRSARSPSDYAGRDETLSFAPGETEQSFVVKVAGDDIDEATESFEVRLSAAENATLDDDRAVMILYDGDPRPTLAVGDVVIPEGSTRFSAAIPVLLSRPSARAISVRYRLTAKSASAGKDFVATSGRLRIPAGEEQGFIVVTVIGDRTDEGDETLTITLSSPVNAILKIKSGVVTITDDDSPPAKPQLRGFKLRPSVITSNGKAKLSTVLNQKATLRIRLQRRIRGRWVGVRSFNVTVDPGLTRLQFAGGGLPPGRYRFVATPRNTNGTGATKIAGFRIRS